MIAAGHLFLQIIHYPGGKSEIMTTQDESLIPCTVAIEASLNACETFMGTAVGLFIISVFKHNIKRCATVLVAGLLCFSAEAFLHFQGPTIEPSMSNFSRPYLLNFAGVIITIIVVLAGVLLVYSGCFLFLALFNYRLSSEFDFEYHGQLIIRVHMTPERLFWLASVTVLPVGLFSGSVLYLVGLGVFGLMALLAIQALLGDLKVLYPCRVYLFWSWTRLLRWQAVS
jgi:hypothetical protein